MKRLDPTTLPGYAGDAYHPGNGPGSDFVAYTDDDSDLRLTWVPGYNGSYGVYARFILPLDILTEEQVIEILRRNGCPVPGGER